MSVAHSGCSKQENIDSPHLIERTPMAGPLRYRCKKPRPKRGAFRAGARVFLVQHQNSGASRELSVQNSTPSRGYEGDKSYVWMIPTTKGKGAWRAIVVRLK
jgi:hypothetical protein